MGPKTGRDSYHLLEKRTNGMNEYFTTRISGIRHGLGVSDVLDTYKKDGHVILLKLFELMVKVIVC